MDIFVFLNFRMKPHIFETLRLILVIVTVVLRIALMPIYLQSYLNLAYDKIMDLRKEAGRITNVEYQKKVSIALDIFVSLDVVVDLCRVQVNLKKMHFYLFNSIMIIN